MVILEVREIHTYYGVSHILFGVSLAVAQGEVVCLLGRNGAGKTTTLRSIMGLTPPRSGSITFRGVEIASLPTFQIARMGIGYVPEDRRIFPDLTVRENLEVAARAKNNGQASWTVEKLYALFPRLQELERQLGMHLSGGEQQMLTIARTLMGNPTLLLLDEPTEGLAPLVVRLLGELMHHLKGEGITILLAEQNLKFALRHADRGYIIDNGRICYHGSMAELQEDEAIKKRYLTV